MVPHDEFLIRTMNEIMTSSSRGDKLKFIFEVYNQIVIYLARVCHCVGLNPTNDLDTPRGGSVAGEPIFIAGKTETFANPNGYCVAKPLQDVWKPRVDRRVTEFLKRSLRFTHAIHYTRCQNPWDSFEVMHKIILERVVTDAWLVYHPTVAAMGVLRLIRYELVQDPIPSSNPPQPYYLCDGVPGRDPPIPPRFFLPAEASLEDVVRYLHAKVDSAVFHTSMIPKELRASIDVSLERIQAMICPQRRGLDYPPPLLQPSPVVQP